MSLRGLSIFFFALLMHNTAYALSCQNDPNAMYTYEMVFLGEAVSTKKVRQTHEETTSEYRPSFSVTSFKVLEQYRGPTSKFVDVYHRDSDIVDTYEDEDGKLVAISVPGIAMKYKINDVRYMFLNKNTNTNQYMSGSCHPTGRSEKDKLILKQLKILEMNSK